MGTTASTPFKNGGKENSYKVHEDVGRLLSYQRIYDSMNDT